MDLTARIASLSKDSGPSVRCRYPNINGIDVGAAGSWPRLPGQDACVLWLVGTGDIVSVRARTCLLAQHGVRLSGGAAERERRRRLPRH